jgi:conjugative relaxase-like TrwC/TraI family protein
MAVNSRPMGGTASDLWNYYTSDGFLDGQFIGRGLKQFPARPDGLTDETLFQLLCAGATPDGRRRIQWNNGKHVPGINLDLSAPKWVSAAMVGATPDERQAIQEAWDEHVMAIFARMEDRANVCRPPTAKPSECTRSTRTKGSSTERIPGHLLGFLVHHHTARPTAESDERGDPPDPHLHSHIFVMNMAWVPDPEHKDGGKWRGVDDFGIKAQAEQMLYESEGDFARRMEDLGYRPEYIEDRRGRRRSTIPSLADACSLWSSNSRRKEEVIADFIKRYDRPPNDVELRDQMRWTRILKDKTAETVVDWLGLAAAAVREKVTCRVDPVGPLERDPLDKREAELTTRLMAANGLCHADSTFDQRSMETSVARCAVGLGMTFAELDDFTERLVQSLETISVNDDHPERSTWTTPVNWDHEWSIYRDLKAKAEQVSMAPSPDAVDRAIAALAAEEGVQLDEEQIEMVKAACQDQALSFHEGYAGTGKSTAAKAIVRAFRDRASTGHPTADTIVAVSTARDTALRIGEKLQADQAHSIESLIYAVRTSRKLRPTARTVIVLDEAAMVDNPRMADLLQAIGDARLICIGDDKQLQAIGAGGWYQDAVKWAGRTMLTNVHRQVHDEDRQALAALRHGHSAEAVASFDARGRIHIAPTNAERMGMVVADYIAARDDGKTVDDLRIVLDGANTQIDLANRIIQQDRLRRGELTGEPMVMANEAECREWSVYVGDEVSFISGHWQEEIRRNIPNGTVATVTGLDHTTRKATIRVKGEDTEITIDVGHQFHARYAVHAQRLQGGEAPITYVMPGKGSSLEGAYSENSRHIEELHLYLDNETHGEDPRATIIEAWKTARPKISARTRAMWAGKRNDRVAHVETVVETAFVPSTPAPPVRQVHPRGRRLRKRIADGFGIGL